MPRLFFSRLGARWQTWSDRVREPSLTVLLAGHVLLLLVSPLSAAHALTYAVVNGMQALLLVSLLALPAGSRVRPLLIVCVVPLLWTLMTDETQGNPTLRLALRMVSTLGVTVAVGQAVLRAPRVGCHQLLEDSGGVPEPGTAVHGRGCCRSISLAE